MPEVSLIQEKTRDDDFFCENCYKHVSLDVHRCWMCGFCLCDECYSTSKQWIDKNFLFITIKICPTCRKAYFQKRSS